MNGNSTSATMPHLEIYTDGGCEPNPRPGGYGMVLLHPNKRAEASGGFRLTTNKSRQHRAKVLCAFSAFDLVKNQRSSAV